MQDLREWDTLYCAGRLQKPVLVLQSTPEIDSALEENIHSALIAGILLSKNEIPLRELFFKIASISYKADIRMQINAENPNKVKYITVFFRTKN